MNYQQEVMLPEGKNNWVIESEAIQTDCRVRFEKNDTKRSKVDQIFLKSITFKGLESEVIQNLELKSISMECPSISNKKISFKKVHSIVNGNTIQFQLQESIEDVKEFIKHDQFSITLNLMGPRLDKKINATLILEFLVEGELIKTILHQRMLV